MVYLGLEPRAAGWKVQTNPLCYGGIPDTNLMNHFNSRWGSVSGQKPSKFGSCIWITVDRAVASDARGPGSSSVIASFCRTFIVKQLFRIDKNIANEASNVHLKLYFVFLPMTVLSLLQLIIPKGQVRLYIYGLLGLLYYIHVPGIFNFGIRQAGPSVSPLK